MQTRFITSASILALILSVASTTARAQDSIQDETKQPPVTTSKSTWRDAEDAKGFRFGNLLLKPLMEVKESYDDNIFTEDSGEKSDWVTRLSPSLVVQTEDTPHKVQFSAGLDQVMYADHSDMNYLNYDFGIKDRYKIDKTLTWEGSFDYRKGHSLPGDTEANPAGDASEALPYNIYTARTSLNKDFGALSFAPRLGFQRYEYENVRRNNGVMLDQGYRDRDEKLVGGRIGYDLRKEVQVFTDLEYAPRDYLQDSATERDSDGGTYMIGTRYRPSKDLTLEIAGGFMDRNYDTAAYDDINAFAASARANWTIQPGSKLQARLNRTIGEVTDANVGGNIRTDLRADFTQDLTDDLSGKLGARWINSDYQGGNGADSGTSDRDDDYYSANVGVKYTLTPVIAFTGDYTYGNNSSNRNSAEYTDNVFMLGVKAGF